MTKFKEKLEGVLEVEMVRIGEGRLWGGFCDSEPGSSPGSEPDRGDPICVWMVTLTVFCTPGVQTAGW
jgi:hypothetical protein